MPTPSLTLFPAAPSPRPHRTEASLLLPQGLCLECPSPRHSGGSLFVESSSLSTLLKTSSLGHPVTFACFIFLHLSPSDTVNISLVICPTLTSKHEFHGGRIFINFDGCCVPGPRIVPGTSYLMNALQWSFLWPLMLSSPSFLRVFLALIHPGTRALVQHLAQSTCSMYAILWFIKKHIWSFRQPKIYFSYIFRPQILAHSS